MINPIMILLGYHYFEIELEEHGTQKVTKSIFRKTKNFRALILCTKDSSENFI